MRLRDWDEELRLGYGLYRKLWTDRVVHYVVARNGRLMICYVTQMGYTFSDWYPEPGDLLAEDWWSTDERLQKQCEQTKIQSSPATGTPGANSSVAQSLWRQPLCWLLRRLRNTLPRSS